MLDRQTDISAKINQKSCHPELVCLLSPLSMLRNVRNGLTACFGNPCFRHLSSIVSGSHQLAKSGKIPKSENHFESQSLLLRDDKTCLTNRGNRLAISPFIRSAFTLAEVLITLTIIGVLAAMTIPTLMNNINNMQYKIAYKKAYSEFSQAFLQAISEQSLTSRKATDDADATASEWAVIKNAFKVSKDCPDGQISQCWAPGDTIWNRPAPGYGGSPSFIDASGRAWVMYYEEQNMYFVDTNGNKKPNKFGQDRWIFTMLDDSNEPVETGLPTRVGPPFDDFLTSSGWCNYPPCYYKSWLFN